MHVGIALMINISRVSKGFSTLVFKLTLILSPTHWEEWLTTAPLRLGHHRFDIAVGLQLKSIHVHLSPRSTCGLVAYTLRILAQRYTFFMGHTAIFYW